eukprot:Gb_02037 [translate_table: standard]
MANIPISLTVSPPYNNRMRFVQMLNHKHICTQALELKQPIKTILNGQLQTNDSPCAHILTLCRNGRLKEALDILHVMDQRGIAVESNTYVSLLQACGDSKALAEGKQVHTQMLRNVIEQNVFIKTNIVTMYGKCGSVVDARIVFDSIADPNVFSWNAMIRGYAAQANSEEVLALYHEMQQSGIRPDSFTFSCVLKACGSLGALQQGKDIHEDIIRTGLESDVYVGNALAAMYAKCGSLQCARHVFDNMSQRDVVSWNGMIAGYVYNGRFTDALELFRQMLLSRMKTNSTTIVGVLPACAELQALQPGKEIHDYVIRNGFESDALVRNSLVTVYAKCGSLENACRVFDKMSLRDVASWTAMIAGYAQNGHCDDALKFFRKMQFTGVNPSSVSISSVLPACAHLGALEQGKEIHASIIRRGIESNVIVVSALVAMYAKCDSIEDACKVFNKISQKDVVAWNVMIAGYAQNSHYNKVLELFGEMQEAAVEPDPFTIVSVLSACAGLASLQHGKEIHDYVIRRGFESNVIVGSALVDMYAKCGSVENARQWFNTMSQRDLVSWNAMIAGYGMHGHGEEALALFYQMQQMGMKPDSITVTGILSACSHAGLVDEGWDFFDQITRNYHITPSVEHYACMVDLLGRAGCLHEAHDFIRNMPLRPNGSVWGALLGACRIHCNVELGQVVAECLFELEPENEGNYVLLSNIYAATGRWTDVEKVRKMMKDRGLKKKPGCSWVEIQNKVHVFRVGDKSHPQTEKIYGMLESLTRQMKKAGYVPDTKFVLYDVEETEKERILCSHSERLAIVFGFINTCDRTPIRITKNLRVCGDCHTATKFISKIAEREIIVRDANRFHHFKDGLCSCGDYW